MDAQLAHGVWHLLTQVQRLLRTRAGVKYLFVTAQFTLRHDVVPDVMCRNHRTKFVTVPQHRCRFP
jgi:phenylalanine-4-hydroxylase